VITLIALVLFLIIDRYLYFIRPLRSNTPTKIKYPQNSLKLKEHLYYEIYQINNYALMGKFVFHIFQFILIHFMVFWYWPNTGNMKLKNRPECTKEDINAGKCNEPASNIFLLAFYLIYCVYFVLSALQIQHSWPEVNEDLVHKSSDTTSKLGSQIFYAIPFAWEIQQVACWLWTKTSFDIFQWLKFEEIYFNLFIVKCNAKSKRKEQIGAEVKGASKKIMGGCGLFILILLIIVPILVFSTLNPMMNLNNITKASLNIQLEYGDSQTFEFIKVPNAAISVLTADDFERNEISTFEEIRGETLDQFQWVKLPNASDYYSFPTEQKRLDLLEFFWYNGPHPKVTLELSFERPVFLILDLNYRHLLQN